MLSTRSVVLAAVSVALAVAALASPAAGHPPTQHEAQMLPESALGVFNVEARMAGTVSAGCEDGMAGAYPCKNVDLAGFTPLPMLGGATGNDIWGWTDPETGSEYAIMGTSTSTGFVDVTDPANPRLVGILPTRGTPDQVLWRDIKVDGNYAFIVAEITDSGLQVFDLTRLRDAGPAPAVFTSDATYDEFSSAHNISINTETDTAYVVGTDILFGPNTCGNGEEVGGLHMVDISDPLTPTFAGCALVEDAGAEGPSNNYAHDVECIVYDGPDTDYAGREICFGSNEDAVVIYDVTDRANPKVLSQTTYPTAAYTHQGSLTEDRRYFIFGDELDEGPVSGAGDATVANTTTYILDVQDLDAPPTPKAFSHETNSIDHNLYIHGNRVYASNYGAGLRLLDFDNARLAAGQLDEVGYFDVVPGADPREFAGTWSNYRFPGSGNVAVSAIENEVSGLFMLTPTLGPPPKQDPPAEQQQPQPQPPAQQPSPAQQQEQPAPPASDTAPTACASRAGFRSTKARPVNRRRNVRLAFERRGAESVDIDVFQTSTKGGSVGEWRVAVFRDRTTSKVWNGRSNTGKRVRDGVYFVRFRTTGVGRRDWRRHVVVRKRGRFFARRTFYRPDSCGLLSSAKLYRAVFGGSRNLPLRAAFRLGSRGDVSVVVRRGNRVMKRIDRRDVRPRRTHRLLFRKSGRDWPRGLYRVSISVRSGERRAAATLVAQRLR